MATFPFYLASIFSEKSGSGDSLVIFEHSAQLSEHEQQMLAYQMGGNEVVFLNRNKAQVSFFHPQFSLPFSGKGLLGAAALLLQDKTLPAAPITLHCSAGSYQLGQEGEYFHLNCPAGRTRPSTKGQVEIAFALGIHSHDILMPMLFADTGVEQLIVQVRSRQNVLQARPHSALLAEYAESPKQATQVAIWHRDGDLITMRSFTVDHFNIYEDFGAASSALNLASAHLASGGRLPFQVKIEQGHTIEKAITRLSHLYLQIDTKLDVHLKGKVQFLGSGQIET
ncbi:PhzF family phenazine biosynthesis protein [Chitinibacter sp. SCUT-21]|uniref:PhzF family phenazine biosynthesis protein n=1 Tax=Chitinibacter sp. SCUT-21 TaxID=2970891 RepID=UPI0035A5712F